MAVYTSLSDAEVRQLLHAFDLRAPARFRPIPEGIENTNYRVETGSGCYVLTVYERSPAPQVDRVLATVARLADAGVPCPRPVPRADRVGGYLTTCRDKPVSVSPFVEGVALCEPDEARLEAVGRTVAELHLAGAGLELDPPASHRLDVLLPEAARVAEQVRDRRADLARLLIAEAEVQQRCAPHHLPCGLIHADLFRDNVLFHPERPAIAALLDFHLAGRGPWMYDLAVVLLDFCWQAEGVVGDRARAVLRGYRSVRAVSGEEFQAVPILLRRAALRFLCLRLQRFELAGDTSEVGVRKDPAEMERKLLTLGGGQPVGP